MSKSTERHKNDIYCLLNLSSSDSVNNAYASATVDIQRTGPDIQLIFISRPGKSTKHHVSNRYILLDHLDAQKLLLKLRNALIEAERFL